MRFLLPTQPLKYPILKRSVRRQFLKYRSLERRVVVEMLGQEPSELSIPVRSLSQLMEHLVHKVLILCAPCHKLLPQGLISQNPIHHRRIRRHCMGTGRESERETNPQPSRQPPHGVLLEPDLRNGFTKPLTESCRVDASLGVLVPTHRLPPPPSCSFARSHGNVRHAVLAQSSHGAPNVCHSTRP